jgi:hypothetical protein
MEQVLDWLNENELRAFPLLNDTDRTFLIAGRSWVLPDDFILDLQITVKSFNLDNSTIARLSSIEHTSSGSVIVAFSISSTQVASFEILSPATQSYPFYLRTPDGNLAVFGSGVLSFLTEAPPGLKITTDIPIEPSTYAQFNGAWLGVNSFITSPEKVSYSPLLVEEYRIYEPSLPLEDVPSHTVIHGDIAFLEGYNFRVAVAKEKIDLEIGYRYGLIMNCATSFIPQEYLNCKDMVSYINGVPPDASGNFRLTAGTNINITKGSAISTDFYDPVSSSNQAEKSNDHTLFVGLNFQATDICAPINVIPQI